MPLFGDALRDVVSWLASEDGQICTESATVTSTHERDRAINWALSLIFGV